MERVVVTGMGCLTPIGNNISDYWNSLVNGVSGANRITHFDASSFKTQFACEIKGFDLSKVFTKNEIKRYDPFTLYALEAVQQALTHSQYEASDFNLNRVGVIWGSGNGGVTTNDQQLKEYFGNPSIPRFSPFYIPRILVDIVAGVISMQHGFKGVNFSTISACASATTAMIEAFNYLRLGKADMIVTGGSEAPITPSTIGGFNALKALSTKNASPTTASRPFDRFRDGFVMGEGAGALVLETLSHAQARNAPILAEMKGGGLTADAYHLTGTHPEGDGAFRAMQLALEEAELQPGEMDYVNAHATSTKAGDISEWKALKRLFSHDTAMNATKSMTGHLLGAAGAIEAIATLLTLQHDCIPGTINFDFSDLDLNQGPQLITQTTEREVNNGISNTFGFGGHIASVIFGKYKR